MNQPENNLGLDESIGAYVCAINETDPDNIVIVNINVSPSPELANSRNRSDFSVYTYLLNQSNIPYWFTDFQGAIAVEYSFTQLPPYNIPTKAIFFIKNNKGYLLQIATKNNLETRYKNMRDSFLII